MDTNMIKIDRNLLIEELYKLLAIIDVNNPDARKAVMAIVTMVTNAPADTTNRQYARIKARNR